MLTYLFDAITNWFKPFLPERSPKRSMQKMETSEKPPDAMPCDGTGGGRTEAETAETEVLADVMPIPPVVVGTDDSPRRRTRGSKLTQSQAMEIKRRYEAEDNPSMKALGDEYGVSAQTILRVVHGEITNFKDDE